MFRLINIATPASNDPINHFFGIINHAIGSVFFFDLMFFDDTVNFPLTVAWLITGAVIFSIYFRFINFRLFKHAINIVRGKYDRKSSEGDISHFKALTTALSATVGLGNIAGVAIAITLGGPGATLWMIIAGLLGMNSKFAECSLAMLYREKRADGYMRGGPMDYLSKGLAELGMAKFGKFLAILFAILTIGGSFGGGSSFQVNQSLEAVAESFPFFAEHRWVYGLIMAILTGVVIIGGIQRIAGVAEKIVPLMCGIYICACLYILFLFAGQIPATILLIFKSAFSFNATYGGFIGVLVTGFKRAAFSNEAGVGSAAIAHSAAKAEYPIQEGIVALLEPFIDTVVICTLTALVIIITGSYNNPEYADLIAKSQGAALTSRAIGGIIYWFPYVLAVSVWLFAYSTIISWSYYGERCFSYIFGEKYAIIYKILLCIGVFLGSITTSTNVLEFGDLMILGMAFPNILGVYFLLPRIRKELNEYLDKIKNGIVKSN